MREEMTDSIKKYMLLKSDTKIFVHPTAKPRRLVKLYRILALRDMYIHGFGHITEGTIGGYVENESNLSHDGNSWVANLGNVFDHATLLDDALVKGDSAVFGEVTLCGQTVVSDFARVGGGGELMDCYIYDKCNVRGTPKMENVTMRNSTSVKGNPVIKNTVMTIGAMVHGEAIVNDCKLRDVTEIYGTAAVGNSVLSGRAVIKDDTIINQTIHVDVELHVTSGKGSL